MNVMTARFSGVSFTVVFGMFFVQPVAAKTDAHNATAVRPLRIQHITGSTLLFATAFPIIHRRLLNPIIFDLVKESTVADFEELGGRGPVAPRLFESPPN
jgi:hypothetical protein